VLRPDRTGRGQWGRLGIGGWADNERNAGRGTLSCSEGMPKGKKMAGRPESVAATAGRGYVP